MLPQQLPEIQRSPLESVCLRIKMLGLGSIAAALAQTPEPPGAHAVEHVLKVLGGLGFTRQLSPATATSSDPEPEEHERVRERSSDETPEVPTRPSRDTLTNTGLFILPLILQACAKETDSLEQAEALTALGAAVASLPVDPRIGKLALLGAIFRCLEPTLILAAALATRSPFLSPFAKRDEAAVAKRSIDDWSGEQSECLPTQDVLSWFPLSHFHRQSFLLCIYMSDIYI
jgi:HrpA-like RNA helicase|eukprot:COSAG03_NODE_1613_length_3771_cov_3.744281_5_plen_231_part_00